LVPGEDPESVEAFYFTVTGFAGQRRSATQILRNERSTDLMLTVPQITSDVTDISGPLLSMNIDIDDDGPCFSELAGFTCGKDVTSKDIIRVSSTVFTKTTYSLSAMDTINPFSAKVLIDGGEEQYGYTAIVVPQFVKAGNGHFAEQIKAFNSQLGENALTAMIASTPTAMLDYKIATDNFAYAARIPANASYFDFTMHKTWDQIFDGQSKDQEDYQTEIRQWPLGDDGFGDFVTVWSDLPRKWSPDNFNVTDSTSIRGFSTSLYSALTFGPYYVEKVYFPPPPTIYSPPPPAPPLSPPMPVYVEYVEGDLDRSVVIVPSLAVLTVFAWMLWMFFKRRRNLQMMHIDFIDEDYDGALDDFDSSSSDDDSDNEGSANTGSGGGLFGFGRKRPEVQERYNRSQRIRALEERLQQTQSQ
jgi:hypothetical protein